jgi:hypothetical protein
VESTIAQQIGDYHRRRESLRFLDCNLWMGRPSVPEFVGEFDLNSLRRRMTRYGVQGGVVSHFACVNYGQAWGNDRVLAAISGTGLWGGVVLVPEMFRDEVRGRSYLADLISRGARLARVYPGAHHFSVRDWCSGALVRALADCRMPLMVRHTELSWEEIRALCDTYPSLTVIVEAVEQKMLYHNRRYYPLIERYPNLRLELHSFVGYLALEDVVGEFGAGPLIFGSYMPICDPNAGMMQVTHARISDEEKGLIARGNLLALVEGVRPA